ncbi:MAG: cytochrome c5 family protein [Hahellaceae bacterium]|nr:cytochrome c5 family protein [Hahellaceae bacterium]MCP5169259.1 cytochrome c5 family protein [Hahellaceae bacterium]
MKTAHVNARRFPLWVTGCLFLLGGCQNATDTVPESVLAGEAIFTGTCKVCHAQGINGAPIAGNAKMWAPRAAQGKATLLQHAIQGFGMMPAKGGNDTLQESDLSAAIDYMLYQGKLLDTALAADAPAP